MRRGTKTHNCLRCPSITLPRSKKPVTWAASSFFLFLCVLDLVVALPLGSSHTAATASGGNQKKDETAEEGKREPSLLVGMLSLATALPRTPLAPGANQWAILARRGTESNTIFAENVQRIQFRGQCAK